MQVIATAVGFDGLALRQPGETFEMPEGARATWFRQPSDPPPKPAKAKADKQPSDPPPAP